MRAKPSVPRARVTRVNNDSRALRYDPIGASRYTIPPYIPPFPQGGLNAEKQLSRMAASLLESRLRSKSPLCGKGGWSEGPGGIVSLRRFLFIASRLSRTTRLTSGFAIQKSLHGASPRRLFIGWLTAGWRCRGPASCRSSCRRGSGPDRGTRSAWGCWPCSPRCRTPRW